MIGRLGVAVLFLLCGGALAVEPDERLADPALEARARAIGQSLRCLVCRNQSIDDSDADLARDLRRLVRRRLVAGDGDGQAVAYIQARYGDYVLLKPPFKPATYALWLGPPALLLAGAAGVVASRRRRAEAEPALSAEERARLARLLEAPP